MPPGSSYTSRLSEEPASLTSHEVMESLLPATFRAVLVHKGMSDSSVMSATTGPSLPAKTCLCGTTAPLRPPRGPAAWPRPEFTEPRPPPPPRRTPQRGPPGCTRLRPRWEALHRWGGWAFEHGVGWTELPTCRRAPALFRAPACCATAASTSCAGSSDEFTVRFSACLLPAPLIPCRDLPRSALRVTISRES